MGDLTVNFSSYEFRCPCCEASDIDVEFVDRLQFARDRIGKSMSINSGYRCYNHNRDVGGVDDSAHRKGLACDIRCSSSSDRLLYLSILPEFFNRIGVASNFIHVDLDESKAPDVLWLYPPKK
jgi:zinc D-Ala-D-Ala carboxypeptidase